MVGLLPPNQRTGVRFLPLPPTNVAVATIGMLHLPVEQGLVDSISTGHPVFCSGMVQSVARRPLEPQIAGSNPRSGTSFKEAQWTSIESYRAWTCRIA